MSITKITRIHCDDTGNTYNLPKRFNPTPVPNLLELRVELRPLGDNGVPNGSPFVLRVLHVERQTLVDFGQLAPVADDKAPAPQPKSTEELLVDLLEKLIEFPEKED